MTDEMIRCPHCGQQTRAAASFCTRCGQRREADVPSDPLQRPTPVIGAPERVVEHARRRRLLATAVVVALAVVVGVAFVQLGGDDPSGQAPPTGDLPPGRIVFASDRAGNHDIFIADADGSNVRNLTDAPSRDEPAGASRDGSLVAFRSDREDTNEIFAIDPDGGDVTRLTDGEGQNFWPTFSPDGSQIAFTRDRDGDTGIWVMGDDGQGARLVVSSLPDFPGFEVLRRPTHARSAFTSDGSAILFEAIDGDNIDLFEVSIDGRDITRLTDDDASDRTPSMSPDGDLIVFTSNRNGENAIYTMRNDGSDVTRISGAGSVPSFTPDGDHIVFIRNSDVWVMERDGEGARAVITDDGNEHAPVWVE